MIETTVRRLLELSDEAAAKQLNSLTDEFRRGRSPSELSTLLKSRDDRVLSVATYIAKEIREDLYTTDIVDRLWELTKHSTFTIKMYSVTALYPLLTREDPRTLTLLQEMAADDHPGVRMRAAQLSQRLSIRAD